MDRRSLCFNKSYNFISCILSCSGKVSCDGVRQLSLDSWPTIVGRLAKVRWTLDQSPLDSWPTPVGHLAKSGDFDKYI